MNVVVVTARTGIKNNEDQGGTENKFYRTYEIPNIGSLFQWGSARTTKSGGQWKATPDPSDAAPQFRKKQNGGYVALQPDITFNLDIDKLVQVGGHATQSGQRFIENVFHAAARNTPTQAASAPTSVSAGPASQGLAQTRSVDRLALLSTQVLDAIALASGGDLHEAIVAASNIRDNVADTEDEIEKIKSYLSTLDTILEVSS